MKPKVTTFILLYAPKEVTEKKKTITTSTTIFYCPWFWWDLSNCCNIASKINHTVQYLVYPLPWKSVLFKLRMTVCCVEEKKLIKWKHFAISLPPGKAVSKYRELSKKSRCSILNTESRLWKKKKVYRIKEGKLVSDKKRIGGVQP